MARFIVLMTENDDAWGRLPDAERRALLDRYAAWVAELKRGDRLRDGAAIGEPGRVLRAAGGAIVDEAFAATRDVPTGYFTIEATDLDDAAKVARGCPALLHGETVIVRPLGHG